MYVEGRALFYNQIYLLTFSRFALFHYRKSRLTSGERCKALPHQDCHRVNFLKKAWGKIR